MSLRIVVLGAGFGGLELTAMLAEALPGRLDLTLIDRSDAFVFGFSKLDIVFSGNSAGDVRIPYSSIVKPGVRFVRDSIRAIDPVKRRVTTEHGVLDADVLVVALGADYDMAATPGLAEAGNEFYSVAGAERLRDVLPSFTRGNAIVGVTSAPFKCPPAPSEAALLLHDYLTTRGVRGACTITLVMPFGIPIPPSPATSEALLAAFAERGITFMGDKTVKALDGSRRVAILKDTRSEDTKEMPYDLFLGIPRHRAPDVVEKSGLTKNGWIPVDPKTLRTEYPGVYAVGDVTSVGTPKAGVFAEGAARVVASALIAEASGGEKPPPYNGAGSCYIEFGGSRVGRVDVDFFSGPKPTGTYVEASIALREEKKKFGSGRRARWFGS